MMIADSWLMMKAGNWTRAGDETATCSSSDFWLEHWRITVEMSQGTLEEPLVVDAAAS